jgi:hypothetical protein
MFRLRHAASKPMRIPIANEIVLRV